LTESADRRTREEPRVDTTLDPIDRQRTGGAVWGWVAGIAVLILIAFVLIGGWGGGNGDNVARAPTASPPATTGTAPAGQPPATTGTAPTSQPPAR
jgi:hypothetical protein